MKVLFLDFDGVLNTFTNHSNEGNFSPSACKNVNKLLNKFKDLKIVVSSSLRHEGLEYVKSTLDKNGIDPSKVIDITGDDKSDGRGDRGYHIDKWLKEHKDVKSFVILDDESDMDELVNKMVKVNPWVGITEKDIEKAIDILNQ